MEQCDQKILSLSDKFQMIMYGLGKYFLEVSAYAFLKVATKDSLEVKNQKI